MPFAGHRAVNLLPYPLGRVDGRAKVTGEARYAGEYNIPGLTYGVVVSGTIARGTITRIALFCRPAR